MIDRFGGDMGRSQWRRWRARSDGLPSDEVVGPDERDPAGVERQLADFSTTSATLRLVPLAVVVGVLSAVVALGLLKLIALCTSLAYFGEWSTDHRSPLGHSLGGWAVVVPVIGGLLVGLMAKFGSERIRGHGIPEAMETILVGGSKALPRVAVLKPISSAISIGSGGPFGAEGPIILTGGAVGSVLSQFFHLTAIERRSLLVAGAAGGMSAVFGTPIAAVLLGVELLVFEWRPRSMTLIAISSVVAGGIRVVFSDHGLLEAAPLFPTDLTVSAGAGTFVGAVAIGLLGGGAAWLLTKAVYGAEDLFAKLPIHWVWWPAIGGVVIGVGGLIEPRALGVGYETIAAEINGELAFRTLVAVFVVKLVIWALALGSGTSGGILAPILIMGAAAGGLIAPLLPGGSAGAWSLLGLAACLAGVTRSPFTAVVFALELTHDIDMLLPLLLASAIAHLVSVLLLKRSILTEKVARRGFHVVREYSVDPLDALFVRDVMDTDVVTLEPARTVGEIHAAVEQRPKARRQRLLPVVDDMGDLVGALPWVDVLEDVAVGAATSTAAAVMKTDLVLAFPDETLREVADRMAERQVGVLPVVERARPTHLRGILTQFDLLAAREKILVEERHRERVLSVSALPTMMRSRLRLTEAAPVVEADGDVDG
jgi:H+/Cl- antiporter ClcA/predicted transcriptional regulator